MNRDIFGLLLIAAQCGINIPIIFHLLKKKTGKGISLTGETIWIAGALGWILYGFTVDSFTLVISGSVAVVSCGLTSFLISRYDRPPLGLPIGAFFGVLALIIASLLVSKLALALAVFGAVQFLPQLFATLKALRTGESMEGVSVLGSSFRAVYTAGWAVYAGAWMLWGFTAKDIDWPLLSWGLTGFVVFGLQSFKALEQQAKSAIQTATTTEAQVLEA